MKFLEYDRTSGKIICELISESKPEATGNLDFLEIPEDEDIDTSLYAVKEGLIVKLYETNEERLERERIRKERAEAYRSRMKSLPIEFVFALMHDDEITANKCKKELHEIERYL